MSCPSRSQCILHSKLINWDSRSRIIEHRVQQMYSGKRRMRQCSLRATNWAHLTRERPDTLRNLGRQLTLRWAGETDKMSGTLPKSMKPHRISELVDSMVPPSNVLRHSMLMKAHQIPSSQLTLNHLADLPSICLLCMPQRELTSTMDELLANRAVRSISQYSCSAGPGQMGSALFPTWLAPTQPGSSRRGRTYDAVTHRPQLRVSAVLHGRQVKLVSNILSRYQNIKRRSSTNVDLVSGGRWGDQSVENRQDRSRPRSISAKPKGVVRSWTLSSATAGLLANTVEEEGMEEMVDRNSFFLKRTGQESRSVDATTARAVNHQPSRMQRINRVAFQFDGTNWVANKQLDYTRTLTERPACLYTMKGMQKNKWLLREFLHSIIPKDQCHPQILTKSRCRRSVNTTKMDQLTTESTTPQAISFYSTKPGLQSATSERPSTGKLRKLNVLNRMNSSSPMPGSQNKNIFPLVRSNIDARSTTNIHASLSKSPKKQIFKKIDDKQIPHQLSHTKATSSQQSMSIVLPCSNIEANNTWRMSCRSPKTPPYTPVWARRRCHSRIRRTTTANSIDSSDCSSYLNEYLAHYPTPEDLSTDLDSRIASPQSDAHRDKRILIEFTLPERFQTQSCVRQRRASSLRGTEMSSSNSTRSFATKIHSISPLSWM